MALTFNMHFFTAPNVFLLFGYLQPSRARATGALQAKRDEERAREGRAAEGSLSRCCRLGY